MKLESARLGVVELTDAKANEILARLAPNWKLNLTPQVVARCLDEIANAGSARKRKTQFDLQQKKELQRHLARYV